MEPERLQASVIEYFAELDDPRRFNRRHKVLDILVIAICAAIAGADDWEHVELFAETNEECCESFWNCLMGPRHDLPSAACLRRWMLSSSRTALCNGSKR